MEVEGESRARGAAPPEPPVERTLRRRAPGLVLALGALGLAAVAGVAVVMRGDASGPYALLGRNVSDADALVSEYLGCALGQGRRFPSNAELEAALDLAAAEEGAAFAARLHSRCDDLLAQLAGTLAALIPPEDLAPATAALVARARGLESAARAYAAGLKDEPGTPPSPRGLSRAWYEYRRAFAALNGALRARLSESRLPGAPRSDRE
ncbi:MAG: hypothetical protein AAF447_08795 [Myxococcota bacterium]